MSNEVLCFMFKGNVRVRVVQYDGKPWFVAVDLLEALGLSNGRDLIQRVLTYREKRREFLPVVFSYRGKEHTGNRKMLLVSESGMYTLIMRSNKAEAKEFREWVTGEVLPSIRETGRYVMPNSVDVPAIDDQPVKITKKLPCTITMSAGTSKLSLVVSVSSEDSLSSERVKELYMMVDEMITRAMGNMLTC